MPNFFLQSIVLNTLSISTQPFFYQTTQMQYFLKITDLNMIMVRKTELELKVRVSHKAFP